MATSLEGFSVASHYEILVPGAPSKGLKRVRGAGSHALRLSELRMQLFAYNWKLPAYSGAFYLQLTI